MASRATAPPGRMVRSSWMCESFDAPRQEKSAAGKQDRGECCAEASTEVEVRRSLDVSGQALEQRADDFAQADEERKNQRVMQVPEVVDRHPECRAAYPKENCRQ